MSPSCRPPRSSPGSVSGRSGSGRWSEAAILPSWRQWALPSGRAKGPQQQEPARRPGGGAGRCEHPLLQGAIGWWGQGGKATRAHSGCPSLLSQHGAQHQSVSSPRVVAQDSQPPCAGTRACGPGGRETTAPPGQHLPGVSF